MVPSCSTGATRASDFATVFRPGLIRLTQSAGDHVTSRSDGMSGHSANTRNGASTPAAAMRRTSICQFTKAS